MTSDTFTDRFEFPILTKIMGNLNYPVLKKLKDEVKADASAIYSELGGGGNGHLGLVTNATEYASVNTIAYTRHVQPTRPTITSAMLPHTVQKKLDEYKENKEAFKEMTNLEKALLNIISQAVPEMYLKPYRNEHSNAITTPIPDIFNDLMAIYGVVPEDDLVAAESALRARVFDIAQPLVIIYNEMDDLQQLATAAGVPYTEAQFVNLGIRLIKNMNDFDKGLTKWFEKTSGKNYIGFKNHFTREQNNLRQVRGPTMQSGILRQQANLISSSILHQLKDEREGYVNAVTAVEQRILEAVGNSTPEMVEESSKQVTQPAVNAIASNDVMVEVLKLLKELKEDANETKRKRSNTEKGNGNGNRNTRRKNNNNNNNGGNRSNGHQNNNNNGDSNQNGGNQNQQRQRKQIRYNISKYCWSCGATNHPSRFCRFKKEGHKDNATFANRFDGSTEYCQITT